VVENRCLCCQKDKRYKAIVLLSNTFISLSLGCEEKEEEKEELEEELRKRRRGTERADRHEGLYQISDQSVHKQLREMHSK
jgi:hypothetical protein